MYNTLFNSTYFFFLLSILVCIYTARPKKVAVWVKSLIVVVIMFLPCYMFGNSSSNPNKWSV